MTRRKMGANLSALHPQNLPQRTNSMADTVTAWAQTTFRWKRAVLRGFRLLSAMMVYCVLLPVGVLRSSGATLSMTSAPIRLRPGETSFAIPVARFDPGVHPDAPVLQQVVFSVNATFMAGIRLTDAVSSNSSISYGLGPAFISIRPVTSNPLVTVPLPANLKGTNLANSGGGISLTVQTVGQQIRSYTNTPEIGFFVGTNSWLYDVDFLAPYPPYMKTDRVSATALFYDDAVVVEFIVQYISSPVIAILGPSNFVYNGGPQGPTNVSLAGSPRGLTFVYQGVAGTVYGPSPHAPKNVGTFAAIASVAADGTNRPSTSDPFQFQIQPAALSVVAESVKKPYGTTLLLSDLAIAFAATGLQGGDRITSVTPQADTGSQAGAPEGVYSYTIDHAVGPGFDENNYQIDYLPGLLMVTSPIPKVISTGDKKGVVTIKPLRPAGSGSESSETLIGSAMTSAKGTEAPGVASAASLEPIDSQTDVPFWPGWALLNLMLLIVGCGAMRIRPK